MRLPRVPTLKHVCTCKSLYRILKLFVNKPLFFISHKSNQLGDTVHFEIIWKMSWCSNISFVPHFTELKGKPQTSTSSEGKMHKTPNKSDLINTHTTGEWKPSRHFYVCVNLHMGSNLIAVYEENLSNNTFTFIICISFARTLGVEGGNSTRASSV